MNDNDKYKDIPKSIAIVSGKGGSGKTMIAALMASILSHNDINTTLVDGDIATGGLTYYLGLKKVENISLGLSNVLFAQSKSEVSSFVDSKKWLQKVKDEEKFTFVGVGDHRRLFKEHRKINFSAALKEFFDGIGKSSEIVIIDCRGGIDQDSLDICSVVDEVILIVETDTTSYQATQHLVDVLYEEDLAHKLKGFIINKAFDDPSTIARNGTASFRTQYLGAIPFDLAATRKFLIGEIPSRRSTFGVQLQEALKKAYPERIANPEGRPLRFSEFKEITLTNIDSARGGLFISSVLMMLLLVFQLDSFIRYESPLSPLSKFLDSRSGVISIICFALLASMDPFRKAVGRGLSWYIDGLKRILNREP